MTTFARILEHVVHRIPGALGGAFAAGDGEMVDYFTPGDTHEWALLTAHYGVVLANLESLFDTQHFGGMEYFVVENAQVDVVVHAVLDGYYALLAIRRPACLATALGALAQAAAQLRTEME